MSEFIKFTLDCIRNEGQKLAWMEERRLEWAPLLASRLNMLLSGKTIVLISDDERLWFETYFLQNINKKGSSRPLLPIVSLRAITLNLAENSEEIYLLNDMLELSFASGFFYFYIGKPNSKAAQIAKSREDSYFWLLDEQLPNSFTLRQNDDMLDFKLLSLFTLFSRSVDGVLFNQVKM